MEQELFEGVKKRRRWALQRLCQENMRRSWFLCFQLAGDAAEAAPLLISAWKSALDWVASCKEPPREDFETLLSWKIFSQYEEGLQPAEEFEALPPPQVAKAFQPLAGLVGKLPRKVRPAYWLVAYGGLTAKYIGEVTEEPVEVVERQLAGWEEQLAKRRLQWAIGQRAAYVRLSTQLRDVAGNGFQEVQVPETLLAALEKQVGLPVDFLKKREKKPWTRKKQVAVGLGIGLGVLLLAVGALWLALMAWNESGMAA